MKKLALCIGINYEGTNNELSECIHDMQSWSAVLQGAGFSVRMLRERFATGQNILDQIRWMLSEAVKGDSLMITYSGHGTQVPDQSGDEADQMDEAWCPADIWTEGPLVDDQLWAAWKSKRPGVQLVVLSDSCHSGSVVKAFEVPAKGRKKFLHHRHFLKPGMLAGRNVEGGDEPDDKSLWPVLLISGCADPEYSYDAPALGNGAFTSYALRALKQIGMGATYNEWFAAIRRALPSRDYPQTPQLSGSFGGKKVFS